MKRLIALVALSLTAAALAVAPAFADGGAPGGPAGKGVERVFSCEHATQRVARIGGRIARIQARIDGATAKKPERAARVVKRLQAKVERINKRIAEKCTTPSTPVA